MSDTEAFQFDSDKEEHKVQMEGISCGDPLSVDEEEEEEEEEGELLLGGAPSPKRARRVCAIVGIAVGCVLFVVLAGAVLFAQIPSTGARAERKEYQYTDVLLRAYRANPRLGNTSVTRIALLGSHDALSYNIKYSSRYNFNENLSVSSGFLRGFAKGAVRRYSKAANHRLYTQLCAGVRYVDLRVTCIDGVFYSSHGLVSDTIEASMLEVLRFLTEHPGEFVILRIQHVYFGRSSWNAFAEFLETVRYNGTNIYDFIRYDLTKSPTNVTYDEITDHATKGGALFITIDEQGNVTNRFAPYFNLYPIWGPWANKTTTSKLVRFLNANIEYLRNNPFDGFCLAQVQTTPTGEDIIPTLFGWSLLKMAQRHNTRIIQRIPPRDILAHMPIFMVDYATSTTRNFNDVINAEVLSHNLNL